MRKGTFIFHCLAFIVMLMIVSYLAKDCDMGGVACVSDCTITCLFFAIFWQL